MEQLSEIWIHGDFTANSALKLRKEILEHAAMGPEFPIVIYINSYGGSVDALNSIIDTIDSLPNQIITVCAGTAMSCGAILLSHGDLRFIGKNSRVMIHQVSSGVIGTNAEIGNTAREISALNDHHIKLLAHNTGQSVNTIRTLYNSNLDKYMNASQSVKFGIADKIGTPRLVIKTNTIYTLE